CARRYLAARSPAGEVVTIPWLDGHSLQGYFLPAPSAGGRAPTVICIGEPGHRKEEFLIKLVPHARERGFSMLAIDLFGDQRDDFLDALLRRRDLESAIPGVMDYLETRGDVDFARVGIIADGWGSSFVS
ncbi:alpha/beta hydrolase family protein, partial [Bradyrhizobium liaoningense]